MTSENKPAGGSSRGGRGSGKPYGKPGNAHAREGGQSKSGGKASYGKPGGKPKGASGSKFGGKGEGKPYGKPGGKSYGRSEGSSSGSSYKRSEGKPSRFDGDSRHSDRGGRAPYNPQDGRSRGDRGAKPFNDRRGSSFGDRDGQRRDDRGRASFNDRGAKPYRKDDRFSSSNRSGKPFDSARGGKPFQKRDGAAPYRKDDASFKKPRRDDEPRFKRDDASFDKRERPVDSDTARTSPEEASERRADRPSYKPRATFKQRGPRVDETGRMVGYGRMVNHESGKKRVERYEKIEKVDRLYAGRQQLAKNGRYVTVPSDSEEFDYRTLEPGDRVVHVAYGEGRVERRMGNKLAVLFGAQKRWFMVPLVFDNGDLRLWTEDEFADDEACDGEPDERFEGEPADGEARGASAEEAPAVVEGCDEASGDASLKPQTQSDALAEDFAGDAPSSCDEGETGLSAQEEREVDPAAADACADAFEADAAREQPACAADDRGEESR